jgi:ABC-type lipoprotein export system ATPase subunit
METQFLILVMVCLAACLFVFELLINITDPKRARRARQALAGGGKQGERSLEHPLRPIAQAPWGAGLAADRSAPLLPARVRLHDNHEATAAGSAVPLFRACGLSKRYASPEGEVVVLDEADFEIHPGITAIIGASGAGKSTLCNLLGALDLPTSGDLWFESQRLWPAPAREQLRHRQLNVAWVFQDLDLPAHLTVREIVCQPLLMLGVPRHDALARAAVCLEQVELPHLQGRLPSQLSRGQRQRVAIARAFASPARVILADEPTGSLDQRSAEVVFRQFLCLAREHARSIVLVTHDSRLCRGCDRVFRCAAGKLIETPFRAMKEEGGRMKAEKRAGEPMKSPY